MYTLYTIPGSCSSGITVLLEKLHVEYTPVRREDVSNYSDMVPTNQVPALQLPDGQIITEGAAIALYLLEKHKSSMLPADLSSKAEFLRWLMFDYATLHPAYGKMFAIMYKVNMDENEKVSVLKQLAQSTSDLWAILDKELENKTFITGEEATIVDYLATIYSSWGKSFKGIEITLGKNVERLIKQVSSLPEFKAAYKKENIEF
ncbi:glutathione S-transferase family protein [Desulfosediminicola flagellatus]|uniref:glutathione S-transferase family protein n=1 Tax=Desulfosediminicola flagellatus TaxID=2569541 RepID=UPI0010AD0183|nr:glutathione S-transferase family protein [Desulfosediminicola flagellatus]